MNFHSVSLHRPVRRYSRVIFQARIRSKDRHAMPLRRRPLGQIGAASRRSTPLPRRCINPSIMQNLEFQRDNTLTKLIKNPYARSMNDDY